MHRHLATLLVALAVSGAAVAGSPSCESGSPIPLTGKSCGKLKEPQLSCAIPKDVEGALGQPNYNTVQRAADIFSWQQFIALNWPAAAGKRGEPAAKQSLAASGPRVWETWKEAYEVYLPDGKKPAAWNTPQVFPAACAGRSKLLMRTAKVSDVVDQSLQALPADATLPANLKDQQGRLVRYEIRLNKTLFDYVVDRGLYDGGRQVKADSIDFPVGSQLVKAAWREVADGETGYFLAADACVCKDQGVDTPSDCEVKRMGLAGFHLMTKTASAPQWIWSTYEQVDNVVARHSAVAPFNDPHCPATVCPPNQQTPDGVATQLSRVIPVPDQEPDCERPDQAVDNVAKLNGDLQKALGEAQSLLANYELINTQWPLHGKDEKVKTAFQVRPALLANTTMESFSQDTSSCMGCHVMSRTLMPDQYVSGDFSFTLNNAQPRPKGARCVDVEASESCSEQILSAPPKEPPADEVAQDWQKVRHGYDVATQTYELLGGKDGAVGNRLHCESCHLNGGGNPDAAWWVDMVKDYPPKPGAKPEDKFEALQGRINSCFENSMNGQKLCAPGQECNDNPHMSGLIAYMEWLTRQYHVKNPGKSPVRYYPDQRDPESAKKDAVPGDAQQGSEIYTQKCAFCHNSDGQGRYAHDTYFRPALWGKDSYNANAGMADPAMLTAFLHANMPYTSGGMLTREEARDLAAFIDGQCRPGKQLGPDGKPCPTSPAGK